MQKEITVIGGDLRIAELIKLFAKDNYKIYTYGFDNYDFNSEDILKMNKLEILTNMVISAIPFSKDGINVNSVFSNVSIIISELFKKSENKKIIAGPFKNDIYNLAKEYNVELVDIMKNEELTILNVIPTAEGAIQIAMEGSTTTLNGENALILGFGRIGKVLAKL